ncbi:YheC/YheD family endospore coat-associated protein [Alkaliphilus metalliredigens]|uniref:YheC/YheD family endospore coat-associated protein n=1 Tax=Alkaliphilus metalliredigens TaxID=208226 RepID=UPI0005A28866|nr:YheC/YheD family protein [Alkaliphilus metalliredigens]
MSRYKTNLNSKQPILGVCAAERTIKRLLKQKETEKITSIKEANKYANISLYFFSAKDVDTKRRRIRGVYYNEKKSLWEKAQFPYPNLIYKTSVLTDKLRVHLLKKKVKPLNYLNGFNKWEVYNNLSRDERCKQYLPLTIMYNSPNDLFEMLKTTDTVYLKACVGRQGKQVIRVIKLPEGGYELSYLKDRLYVHKIDNDNDVVNKIQSFFGEKKFLIQQAIDLITIDKKIVDLRAEVQKNGKGQITVAGIPVRMSQNNAPITTHAQSYSFDYFFKHIMNYSDIEVKELKNKLNQFLNITYQSIEKDYGPIGEIGIDIGLDKKGHLWFIECNSQSRKVSFFKAYDKKTINESSLNLLEYGKYRIKRNV